MTNVTLLPMARKKKLFLMENLYFCILEVFGDVAIELIIDVEELNFIFACF